MADKPPHNAHACALILGNRGVLLRGPSGSGKTQLGHELITHFDKAGRFARWVSDDQTLLTIKADTLIAHAPKTISGMAEIRGLGIIKVQSEPSARIDLIVDLVGKVERMPDETCSSTMIDIGNCGITLPLLQVPIRNSGAAVQLICARLSDVSSE